MEQLSVPVTESSQVAEARRAGAAMAKRLGYDDTREGELAIVITELASNLVKHARGGEILLRPLQAVGCMGMEIISVDRGPGIGDVGRALRDGYSTAGSPGNGFGAVRRLAAEFDLYTQPGNGTAVVARVWRESRSSAAERPAVRLGAVLAPKPGESTCGDAWAWVDNRNGHTVVLADGLGHGRDAAIAANAVVDGLRAEPDSAPSELLEALHARLRPTRGAAVLAAAIDRQAAVLRYAGVGNICGVLFDGGSARHLVLANGIVGHQLRRVQPFSLPWKPTALLVLHSDGLTTQWGLSRYPGLAARDPSVIAAVLYRDFKRGRDDVAVVVVKAQTP